jgi:hypothetical protein
MIKVDLREMAGNNNGEYVFGADDTGSHACYMVYGRLRPGEKDRQIKPGKGHEEMLVAARGSITVTGYFSGTLEEGSAVHLTGDNLLS